MQVFGEINKNYPTMPFSTRVLDPRNARLGLVECLNHGLLHPYPVMHERAGCNIVQLKSTVLLMPNGSDKYVFLWLSPPPLIRLSHHIQTLQIALLPGCLAAQMCYPDPPICPSPKMSCCSNVLSSSRM